MSRSFPNHRPKIAFEDIVRRAGWSEERVKAFLGDPGRAAMKRRADHGEGKAMYDLSCVQRAENRDDFRSTAEEVEKSRIEETLAKLREELSRYPPRDSLLHAHAVFEEILVKNSFDSYTDVKWLPDDVDGSRVIFAGYFVRNCLSNLDSLLDSARTVVINAREFVSPEVVDATLSAIDTIVNTSPRTDAWPDDLKPIIERLDEIAFQVAVIEASK